MPRREMSKKLVPCSAVVQEDLREKFNQPKGFFYHNEAGETFCAVSGRTGSAGALKVAVLKLEQNKLALHYEGSIFFNKRTATVGMSLPGTFNDFAFVPPAKSETGRQAGRIIIEEALRRGAKQLKRVPANKKLAKYYSLKFGFKKLQKNSPVQSLTPETKPLPLKIRKRMNRV